MIQELTRSLVGRGDLVGAVRLDVEALEIFRQRYGNEDIRTAIGHQTLGERYYLRGDLEKAEEHLQEALRVLREFHELSILTLVSLGAVYTAKDDYQKAERVLREALEITLKEFSDREPLVRSYLTQLSCASGDYAEAKAEAERVVKFLEKTESPSPGVPIAPGWLNVQASIAVGGVFARTGQHARAESYLREALTLKMNAAIHRETIKGILGECLTAQKRYAEAETFLLESHESLKTSQVPHSFRLRESRLRLTNLYRDWGKPEQAATYRTALPGD